MNPIGLPFDSTQIVPGILRAIMFSSIAIAVSGLALAFFSSNSLAVVGFSLLGICSIIGVCLIDEAEDLNQLALIQQQEVEAVQDLRDIIDDLEIHTATIQKTNQLFSFFSKKTKKLTGHLTQAQVQIDKALEKAPSTDLANRLHESLERAKNKSRADMAAAQN